MVLEGDAVGEQLFAFERPVDGDQAQLTPPDPESGVEEPAAIVADPEAVAVGLGLTVTWVPGEVAEQPLASVTVTE